MTGNQKQPGIMITDVASSLDFCISDRDIGQFPNFTDPWVPHLKKMEVIRPVLHPKVFVSFRRG